MKRLLIGVLVLGMMVTAGIAMGGQQQTQIMILNQGKGEEGRYVANDNGTVTDTWTNLMWAARDNALDINWANAKSYCENYRGGGYKDWRMPTLAELAGLYNAAKTYKANCGANVHLIELIHFTCCCPWASETRGSDAAAFSFSVGGRGWFAQTVDTGGHRAIPVRSIK
jgi:hypothetical protein